MAHANRENHPEFDITMSDILVMRSSCADELGSDFQNLTSQDVLNPAVA